MDRTGSATPISRRSLVQGAAAGVVALGGARAVHGDVRALSVPRIAPRDAASLGLVADFHVVEKMLPKEAFVATQGGVYVAHLDVPTGGEIELVYGYGSSPSLTWKFSLQNLTTGGYDDITSATGAFGELSPHNTVLVESERVPVIRVSGAPQTALVGALYRFTTPRELSGYGFHPVASFRAFDSRVDLDGRLATGGSAIVSLPTLRAQGAVAAFVTLTVTDTVGWGYLSIGPGGAPQPTTSAINWSASGQTLAASAISRIIGPIHYQGTMGVWAGGSPGSATHFVVDVAGYW